PQTASAHYGGPAPRPGGMPVTSDSIAAKFATGSHDLPVTERLVAFMADRWAPSPLAGLRAEPAAAWTPRRRAAVSERFPGERLVVPAGTEKLRSNDDFFRYRPHSAFAHLTGSQALEG